MTRLILIVPLLLAQAAHGTDTMDAHDRTLEASFRSPDGTARPVVWWHWMNGNVTREGITADLESMKRVGIGGAHLFNVDGGIPVGPVKFMSDEWLELVRHSVQEAERLGLEFGMHNCPGWSSSGGPWNTPEHGMQVVYTSERQVTGPGKVDVSLPPPETPIGHYHDIAVLAFPTPPSERPRMADALPKVTTSGERLPVELLIDGTPDTAVLLPRPSPRAPSFIQLEFAAPFPARQLALQAGPKMLGCGGELQASDDGQAFRKLCTFSLPNSTQKYTFSFPPTSARFYRLSFTRAHPIIKQVPIAEVELNSRVSISNFVGKAFYDRSGDYSIDPQAVNPEEVVRRDAIVDLTAQTTDGKLTWDVPAGDWMILRVGYAPNGKVNHPTPAGGQGLECDKLNKEAVDAHWAGMMKPVIERIGAPHSGSGQQAAGSGREGSPLTPPASRTLPATGSRVFNHVVLDSYEVGTQNWTRGFEKEFAKRRGYDLLRFLPIFSRRIVDSPEITERFLWDLRRTLADLFHDNYTSRLAKLAHDNGLTLSIEPYGNAPADDVQFGEPADVPMTEFWIVKELDNCTRLAKSVANINGRRLVGSESFTAGELGGNQWDTDLFDLKGVGDLILSAGANRFSLHCYTHQPWLNRPPGMTMGATGTHFGRTNTWWELSGPWVQYLARCQAMLQQGRPVVDILFYAGEDVPGPMYGDGVQIPGLPRGYDFDGCDATTLLSRVSVTDGRLVLDTGMSYRMLVLPRKATMRPEILAKIKQLAEAGATVVGPKPARAPGMTNYPACDEEVARLVSELWPSKVADAPPGDVLARLSVRPDFEHAGDTSRVVYAHRMVDDADVYFVSNQRPVQELVECTFRVSGKAPQLWHPDTGLIEPAPVFREVEGRTTVPLRLDPAGSVFVVFRQAAGSGHLVAAPTPEPSQPADSLKVLKAEFCGLENKAHGSVDVTETVRGLVKDGRLIVRVTDELAPKDHGVGGIKGLRVEYEYAGRRNRAHAMQQRVLELPRAEDLDFAPPAYELQHAGGRPQLRGWRDGAYVFRTSAGRTLRAEVAGLPQPIAIEGPWTLRFPPDLGAPPQVTLERLISWTEHPDDGVKFFSGTATYEKEFDLTADLLGNAGRSLVLDLGRLQNVAQVSVNGNDLGVLWKPPFRVDVTSAVKPGRNRLEVRITNLWPNRLIGDERLPDDGRWSGERLKGWPDWLLEVKPSPTGRFTFATRRHWTKDDEPLSSGLFGPVLLRPLSAPVTLEEAR